MNGNARAQTQAGDQKPSRDASGTGQAQQRARVCSPIQPAKLIKQTLPVYPPAAQATHVQGTVIFHAVIGADGTVKALDLVSGPPLLVQSAKDALSQWRYSPLLCNGQPTEVRTQITVAFTMPGAQSMVEAPSPQMLSLYNDAVKALRLSDYAGAAAKLETFTAKNPSFSAAWFALGTAYVNLNNYDKATGAFKKSLERDPSNSAAYAELGSVYTQERKEDEAIALFKKQVELNPQEGIGHANLGGAYLSTGRFQDAATELEAAAVTKPNDFKVQLWLGEAYADLGEEQKALTAFDRATHLNSTAPIYAEAADDLASNNIGLEDAEKYALSAVRSGEQAMEAVTIGQSIITDLTQENILATYWRTLGLVKLRRGDTAGASKFLSADWQMRNDGAAAGLFSQVYEKAGRIEDAVQMSEFALATQNPPAGERERLARLLNGTANAAIDAAVAQARSNLSLRRTLEIDNPHLDGSANFVELFTAGSAAAEVKIAPGGEALLPVSDKLAAVQIPDLFPDDFPTKLALRGRVTCSHTSAKCEVVFADTLSPATLR